MERSDLDFLLTEDQALLAETVRGLAKDQLAPHHEHIDHAGVHPEAAVASMAETGLFGILVPADAGGVGMGMLAHVLAVSELAAGAGVAGAILAAHGIAVDALVASGKAAEQLGDLCGGTAFASLALQESGGGVTARAEGSGDQARLTGEKTQVPFPGRARVVVVLARDSAGIARLYAVDPRSAGVRHDARDVRLGLRGFETASLGLCGVAARELGGSELLERVLTTARINVSALLVGLGRGAIGHGVRYGQERKQFETPLLGLVAMQERLARSDARVAAACALVHGAARLVDRGETASLAAMRARYVAGEAAVATADDVLQVFGGYGYSREYPAERFYRDARFCGFGEAVVAELVGGIAQAIA